MATLQDERLLSKIVHLRYVDGLTQERIAERLRISRFKVLRILKSATERGIVRIEINLSSGVATAIEREIEKRFHLRDSVVISPIDAEQRVPLAEVAAAAAQRLLESIQPSDTLGVAAGSTVSAVIAAIPRTRLPDLKIVPLTGQAPAIPAPDSHDYSADIRRLAERLEAEFIPVPVPRYVSSIALRQAIFADPHLQGSLDYLGRCSMALVGVGSLSPLSESTRRLPLEEEDLTELQQLGAVGEIAGRFYDGSGQIAPIPFDLRHVAITLTQIRAIPTKIAVALGPAKVQAITGALRGGFIDILVTDVATAEAILAADRINELG